MLAFHLNRFDSQQNYSCVGGYSPFEKYDRQMGSSSPSIDVNIKKPIWNHQLGEDQWVI